MLKRFYPLVGVISCGILLYLSFLPYNYSFLIWIALLPLFILLNSKNLGSRIKIFYAFISHFLFFLLLLSWIPQVILYTLPKWFLYFGWLALATILSFYYIFWALFYIAFRKRVEGFSPYFGSLLYIFCEYVRSNFPWGGFPWGVLAYSQYNNIYLIQIAEYTGILGISFLIVLTNGLFAEFFKRRREILGVGILILFLMLFGKLKVNFWEEKQKAEKLKFKVILLHTDFKIDRQWGRKNIQEDIKRNITKVCKNIFNSKKGVKLIVFPETTIAQSPQEEGVKRWLSSFLPKEVTLLMGGDENEGSELYNSAFILKGGRIISSYRKEHLVPFGEYLPTAEIFPFLPQLLPDVSSYFKGKNKKCYFSLTTQSYLQKKEPIRFIPLICFEGVFDNLVRAKVRSTKSPAAIINITNDAWATTNVPALQHFSFSIFRSIENRVTFLRSTNGGVTAHIAPSGRIKNIILPTESNIPTFLEVNL
jgi:apolipoprotein N-acyltransferase